MKKRVLWLPIVMIVVLLTVCLAACEPADTSYKVTYEAGIANATGTAPTEKDHKEGDTFKIKANSFTVVRKEFTGWAFDGKTYQPDADFSMPAKAVTFIAQWKDEGTQGETPPPEGKHRVSYVSGVTEGVTGEMPYADYAKDADVLIPSCAFVRRGYEFTGWKISGDDKIYQPGDTYKMGDENVTFEAQWSQLAEVIVNFTKDSADTAVTGDPPKAINEYAKQTIALPGPGTLAKHNYRFQGWKLASGDTTVYPEGSQYTLGETTPVTFVAVFELDVKLEGRWVLGEVTGESLDEFIIKYDLFIEKTETGIDFIAQRYSVEVSDAESKPQYAGTEALVHADKSATADYTYTFSADNGTYTIKVEAEENSEGDLESTLTLSGPKGTLTCTEWEDFKTDEVTTIPTSGTYSYKYVIGGVATDVQGTFLEKLTFSEDPTDVAYIKESESAAAVEQRVSARVFAKKYIVVTVNGTKKLLWIFDVIRDNSGNVTGLKALYSYVAAMIDKVMDTTEKQLFEGFTPNTDATLIGKWTYTDDWGETSDLYIMEHEKDASNNITKIKVYYSDLISWVAICSLQSDKTYVTDSLVTYLGLQNVKVSIAFDPARHTVTTYNSERADTDREYLTWENAEAPTKLTELSGLWMNSTTDKDNKLKITSYESFIVLNDGKPDFKDTLYKKDTSYKDGDKYIPNNGNSNGDYLIYKGDTVTLKKGDAEITYDNWESNTRGRGNGAANSQTYRAKVDAQGIYHMLLLEKVNIDGIDATHDLIYAIDYNYNTKELLFAALFKKSDSTSETDAADGEISKGEYVYYGDASSSRKLVVEDSVIKLTYEGTSNNNVTLEFYITKANTSLVGDWSNDIDDKDIKVNITSENGSYNVTIKINSNTYTGTLQKDTISNGLTGSIDGLGTVNIYKDSDFLEVIITSTGGTETTYNLYTRTSNSSSDSGDSGDSGDDGDEPDVPDWGDGEPL